MNIGFFIKYNECLFKYLRKLREIYICTKYLATSTYIFKFLSNFNDTIVIVESRYDANDIFESIVRVVSPNSSNCEHAVSIIRSIMQNLGSSQPRNDRRSSYGG